MALPDNILRDREKLIEWMGFNPKVVVDGSPANLEGVDYSGLRLKGANFEAANFTNANLHRVDLSGAQLVRAQLAAANLADAKAVGVRLESASLVGACLERADLARAHAEHANMTDVNASHCELSNAVLRNGILTGGRFRHARFVGSILEKARLRSADLRGADLSSTRLTGTTWHGAKIDATTVLRGTVFEQDHDAPNDGSDEIAVGRLYRWLNWEKVRFVGRLPLFSGSYLLLTLSLAVATAINWLNQTRFAESLHYPIPLPPRLIMALLGSTLLAIGATVFEVVCPRA